MMCPNPTRCEYDDYRRTGTHFCTHGKCIYKIVILDREKAIRHKRQRIAGEIARLLKIEEPTKEEKRKIKELKKAYAESLEEK